jgi:hypothetical protein
MQFTPFNVNTSKPLIESSNEFMFHKKYVSIHSEDRDILRYPNSAEFEIEMPEDILNVASMRLVSWTFPANYNTFSALNSNVTMTFQIDKPYNPNENGVPILLIQKMFEALYYNTQNNFTIIIEDGFYNPQQMVTELTNKFNGVVTKYIADYFNAKIADPSTPSEDVAEYREALTDFLNGGGYTHFIVVYNNVSQRIWFGNICDGFKLTNETQVIKNTLAQNLYCGTKGQLPDFSNWGLPYNLGLPRCSVSSSNSSGTVDPAHAQYNGNVVPRFYYGDVFPGDNGFWLLPNPEYTNSHVQWVECVYKINLMGPAYLYMELDGHNCLNETSPYDVSPYTVQTNGTNGTVNSAFAKISIPTTPISQWFDRDSLPYKWYYPPAERIRRLKIKLRYHNGEVVNFGLFNYSFVLEFIVQHPQMLRSSSSVVFPPPMGR